MSIAFAGIFSQHLPFDDGSLLYIVEPVMNYRIGSRIEVFTQSHLPAMVYGVAVADGDTTPTKAQIKSGQNAAGTAAISASNSLDVGKGTILNFTGLTKNTVYKVCVYLDNEPDTSDIKVLSISTVGNLKQLPGSMADYSGDNVTVTGVADVDAIQNVFYTPYGDTELRASTGTVINKPQYAAATGPNGTPVVKFNGTSRPPISGTGSATAVVDFQAFTIHFLFKAINTTTEQALLTNMVSASGVSASRGFRVTIGSTSNVLTVRIYDQAQVSTLFTTPFTDVTNPHLLTLRYKSLTDGTSTLVAYLDGVQFASSSTLNRIGVPIDTPITFGGFRFPTETFPGRYDFSRCTIYQLAHSNEEINFVWAEYNSKYALSIPMLP
jgi:hypothetical protein